MADVKERERVGSHSGRKRKSPLGWVPWLALLLFLLLAALAWLLIANVNDENDQEGVDLGDDEVAAGAANADGGGDCPSATDVGTQIFADIEALVGCRVDATVTVTSVADDNTFAVTNGETDVLVIDGSKGAVLEDGQEIRMIGEVREFEFDTLAEEIDLEKSETNYEQYEGRTIVVASSTTPA